MKFVYFLSALFVLVFGSANGQNAIVGSGFSTGWGANCNDISEFTYLTSGAGTSYIQTLNANGTGDQFFRFGIDWGGTYEQHTETNNVNVLLTPGTKYHLNSGCTSNGAMKFNVASTSDNYIFKTLNAGTNPTGDFVVFRVEGDVRNVSSVTQSPGVVSNGQAVTVTSNLSGTLNTGQSAYLRFTKNSFATSTVVEMTGSATAPTAEIPAAFNTPGSNVAYYVFTSGSGLTIPGGDADLFTINYETNGGSNYMYSVQSLFAVFDDFNREGGATDIIGVPSNGGPASWTEMETNSSGARINGSTLWFQSNVDDGREAVSYDMTSYYPVSYDASTEDLKWALNMRSNRNNPSGFSTNNYGSAFVIGCNKSDYTDPDAFGYALVIGGSDGSLPEEPLRLVRFENGLTSNTNITEIATIPLSSETIYLSVNVSYVSCTNSWNIIAREEATNGFTNPSIGSFPLSDSGTDNTYTANDLPYMGGLWNHQTDGSSFFRIDNIYIPKSTIATDSEYTWNGGTGDFSTPSNWTPSRDCARARDVLIFDGGTSDVSGVPNQTIGQLIVKNNATVRLRNAISEQVSTLNLTGGTGEDLLIESGSTLNLNSKNASYTTEGIVLNMNSATTGEIAGTLQFDNSYNSDGRRHQLLVKDPDALHVTFGGRVEGIDLLSSYNPFGDTDGLNAVVFESGSTYLHASGANPFGYGQPYSKVVFEPGSWYHYTASGTPAMSGRTYANFKYDVGNTRDLTGNAAYNLDTLIISQGTLNFNLAATGTIAGDIEVVAGSNNLNFLPPSAQSVVVNAVVIQNIKGGGTMIIGPNATLNLQNPNRINIQRNIVVQGNATVSANAVVAFEGENRFTSTGTTTIQNNSKVYIGSIGGISISPTNAGNIRTTNRSYSAQTAYVYHGVANQITGSGLPATLSGNGSLEIDNPGNTVTLTNVGTTATPELTLSNGLFTVGAANTIAISANGNINSISGNFSPGNLAGTVSFIGAGNVSATGNLDFWNVNLLSGTGGVNFGNTGTPAIQNEMVINSGRWVDANGPFYGNGSTLVYNTGGDYTAGTEWYASLDAGRGIPYHVQVGRTGVNNTKLNFGSSNAWRRCRGDMRIGDGIGTGYGFYLSTAGNGDLKLEGDFILNANGSFGANQRAVFFVGSGGNQTIASHTVTHTIDFDYLVLDKSTGDLMIDNSYFPLITTVSALGSLGGDVLVLSNGDLDLQGQTFNLGGTGPYLKVQNGIRNVKSATAANFNVIGEKEVASNLSGSLVFNDQVTVNISDGMDFGFEITTVNATLQINSGGYANLNAPIYGPLGVLKYNTGGNYERRVEWNGNEGNPGFPNDVIVAGNTTLLSGGNLGEAVATEFGARRDVTIEAGSAIDMDEGYDMTVPLKVGRNLIIDGSLSASGTIGGDIYVGGNWVRSASGVFNPNERQVLFNGSTAQTITADGGEIFDYLAFENAGTKTLNDDITVNKNLDIWSLSGAVQPGAHSITLSGNWDNAVGTAAFAEGTSTVILNGFATQELDAIGGETFYNLEMDNIGDGLILNDPISIKGNLHFRDGLIDATVNQVDFENGSTNTGSGDGSYINGFAQKTGFVAGVEFMFPVGQYDAINAIDVYQPAGLIASTTSASARFRVDYNHENYFPGTLDPINLPPMLSPLEKASTCNFWNINQTMAGTDAKVKLYWTAACLDVNDPNSLVVAKVNGGQWESQGQTDVNSVMPYTSGYVVSNVLSAFSPFAIGSVDGINVLPIGLLSFTASAKNDLVETHWVTSTETNNDYFTVERSVDAVQFEEVGRLDGAGNSTGELSYGFVDDAPYSGISYYRLKQTDFDGKFTYSDIRAVEIDNDNGFDLLQVYRGEDGVNLVYRSEVMVLQVEVFDLLGQKLFQSRVENTNGRSVIYPSLVRGIYLLRLSNGVEEKVMKFLW